MLTPTELTDTPNRGEQLSSPPKHLPNQRKPQAGVTNGPSPERKRHLHLENPDPGYTKQPFQQNRALPSRRLIGQLGPRLLCL